MDTDFKPEGLIDIEAEFVYGNPESHVTARVKVSAYSGSVTLPLIKVENGFATGQWEMPAYDDAVSITLRWGTTWPDRYQAIVPIGTLKKKGKIVFSRY